MESEQTTGLAIIITGLCCYLGPGLDYCEYQDTMTMMFTTIIMAGFSAFLTNNEVLNYIILLLAR